MVLDLSKFVFQPRQLQKMDVDEAFSDLANTRLRRRQVDNTDRQATAQLAEQAAQRGDTNSFNAATFAKDRVASEYEADNAKYMQRTKLANAARAALQSGDAATAAALRPALIEAGGTWDDTDPLNPRIEAGAAPQRGALDVQRARAQIYDGSPPTASPKMGSPYSRPGLGHQPQPDLFSGVSPFGPRDNPMDQLPGASAAMAAPPEPVAAEADLAALEGMQSADDAALAPVEPGAPPTGEPVLEDEAEPEIDPETGEPVEASQEQEPTGELSAPSDPALAGLDPESAAMAARIESRLGPQMPQLGGTSGAQALGANPLGTPSFSPYSINLDEVKRRNQAANAPVQQALVESSPVKFRGRAEAIGRNVAESGASPERASALFNPILDKATDMFRTETGADIAGQRLASTQERQADVRAQRNTDAFNRRKREAANFSLKLLAQSDIKGLNAKMIASRSISELIKLAPTNGQAAFQLIATLHKLSQSGVMTDKDYSHAREGEVGLIRRVINTLGREFQGKGIPPDVVNDIIAVADAMSKRFNSEAYGAMDKVMSNYRASNDPAQRAGIAETLRGSFGAEFLPEELTDPNQTPEQPETYDPAKYQSSSSPAAGNDLGVQRLPQTLDGQPKVSPNGVPLQPGSRVPRKPKTTVEKAESLLE